MATILDGDSTSEEEDSSEEDSTEEDSSEEDSSEEFVVPDFLGLGCEIQNRSMRQLGSTLVEERRFKEFFGTSVIVVRCSTRTGLSQIMASPSISSGCVTS